VNNSCSGPTIEVFHPGHVARFSSSFGAFCRPAIQPVRQVAAQPLTDDLGGV
jgi:hypothetical protein